MVSFFFLLMQSFRRKITKGFWQLPSWVTAKRSRKRPRN